MGAEEVEVFGEDLETIIDQLTRRKVGRPTAAQEDLRGEFEAFQRFRAAMAVGAIPSGSFDSIRTETRQEKPRKEGPGVFEALRKFDFGPLLVLIDEEAEDGTRLAIQRAIPVIGAGLGIFALLAGEWVAEKQFKNQGWPPVLHVGAGLLVTLLNMLDTLSSLFNGLTSFLGSDVFSAFLNMKKATEITIDIAVDLAKDAIDKGLKAVEDLKDEAEKNITMVDIMETLLTGGRGRVRGFK